MQLSVILAFMTAIFVGESLCTEKIDPSLEWLGTMRGMRAVMLTGGSLLLSWVLMRFSCQTLLGRLQKEGNPSRRGLRLPGRLDLWLRIFVLGMFGIQLTVGGWGYFVCREIKLQRIVLMDEMALILPFIIMMYMKWYCFYPINRYIREYVVAGQLAEGLATRPVWTRREYISFQSRHGMFIVMIPLLLILGLRDVVYMGTGLCYGGTEQENQWIYTVRESVVALGAGLIFLFSPLILQRIWKTRRLPEGPLRSKLEKFCGGIKLGFRDILLWDTHSAVANAAVMGLWRPIRYVLLSDNIVENMSDEQIEAVFGHEAGHIKHHHIMFMIFFIMGACSLSYLLLEVGLRGLNEIWPERVEWLGYGEWVIGLLLITNWILIFGWVSRRFERQADVHGALAVSETDNEQSNPKNTKSLSQQGAYIMGTTLQRIALLNGISMETRSWRHSSIHARREFLRWLLLEEGRPDKFRRQVWIIKVLILLGVISGVVGWGLVIGK